VRRRDVLPLPLLLAAPLRAADAPIVAVAANMRGAAEAALAAFRKAGGGEIRLVFGATGNFAQQIANGAPFELFLAADEATIFALADRGLVADRGAVYAIGRLALVVPAASGLSLDPGLQGLKAALAKGRVRRLAIANPATAPYGARAREALKAVGALEVAEPRLVTAENIAQALQFVIAGGADAGFTAASLLLAPEISGKVRSVVVDPRLHGSLAQRLVLTKGAGETARMFQNFLLGAEGQAILARYGYRPPG
jgi:molybdate transport system substrate-binding protein